MEELEIKCKIWQVQAGEFKEIMIGDRLYSVTPKIVLKKSEKRVTTDTTDALSKGKVIGQFGSHTVHENVFDEFKKKVTPEEKLSVIKKYNPNLKDSSILRYAGVYDRWLSDSRKKPIKRKTRKPKGAHAKSKTYGVWISKEEYGLVNRALHKFEFKTTTANIAEECRVKIQRVRAVLDVMKDEKKVFSRTDKDGTPIYKLLPE